MSPIMRKAAGARPAGHDRPPRAPMPPRGAASSSPATKGLIIGACALMGVGLIVTLVVLNSDSKDGDKKKSGKKRKITTIQPETNSGPAEVVGFETNAAYRVGKDYPRFELDSDKDKNFRNRALAGNFRALITKEDAIDNLKIALTHLIGDDGKLARASWDFIVAFFKDERIQKKKLTIPRIGTGDFDSAAWRSAFYRDWADWPTKAKNVKVTAMLLDPAAPDPGDTQDPGEITADPARRITDVSQATWDKWMISVRHGAREGEHGRHRNQAITNIIAWGRPGIEKLINQIGGDDVMLARQSVDALNSIVATIPKERGGGTDHKTELPRAPDRERIKAKWLEWYKQDYKDP